MKHRPFRLRVGAASCLASALAAAALTVSTAPAHADGRTTVTNDRGTARADLDYRTDLTVRGRGFQAVKGGFGGVYVMFGWVKDPSGGSWRPSRGGITGQDYRYLPDSEDAADNQGYLRYIAFPGSSTAAEAAATMSPSGAFTVHLTVPGPVFQSTDRDGAVAQVDCRRVTCGIITVGAHGVKNARNESFTPVRFGHVYTAGDAPSDDTTSDGPGTPGGPGDPGDPRDDSATGTREGTVDTVDIDDALPPAADAPVPGDEQVTGRKGRGTPVAAAVTADRTTAIAGHALTFTARGFTAGEQVVAVLDDGVAALGPLQAGPAGDVAGVLSLPIDLASGTHELRLTGAASGTSVSEFLPVLPATDAPAAPSRHHDDGGEWVDIAFACLAALVCAGALAFVLRARRRA